jgi:hypothetical protein
MLTMPAIGQTTQVKPAIPTERSQSGQWVSFKSEKGGFSVSMPTQPTERVQTLNSAAGEINTYLFFTSSNNGSVNYTVSYMDLPQMAASMPENLLLEAIAGGITGDERIKVLSEKAIKLDSYNGREFRIESPTKAIVQHRTYLVKQRVYQIAVEVPAANANQLSGEVDRFLASFKLL